MISIGTSIGNEFANINIMNIDYIIYSVIESILRKLIIFESILKYYIVCDSALLAAFLKADSRPSLSFRS